jgi:hypothetical protein
MIDDIRSQRLASAVPITQPLLLCSQVQRSGGTLLTRLFDGHASCFVHPNELRWGQPEPWPTDEQLLGEPRAAFEQLVESWTRKFARHGYAKRPGLPAPDPRPGDRLPFLFDEELQRSLFESACARSGRRRRDRLNAYLTSLFNAWLDYQTLYATPKRWVVAFEPRFLLRRTGGSDALFADYPDGLLVTIVREPSAWLASYRKHVPSHDDAKALRYWGESLDAGLRAAATYAGHVEILLFEDLVHQTEAVMQRLCDRLGIGFEPCLLTPTYNSMPVESDSSHVTSFGIDPLVTERHRVVDDTTAAGALAQASDRYQELRPRLRLEQTGN